MRDMAAHARMLAVTAQCLELIAPLPPDERRQVMMGMMLASLDESNQSDRRVLADIMGKIKPSEGESS